MLRPSRVFLVLLGHVCRFTPTFSSGLARSCMPPWTSSRRGSCSGHFASGTRVPVHARCAGACVRDCERACALACLLACMCMLVCDCCEAGLPMHTVCSFPSKALTGWCLISGLHFAFSYRHMPPFLSPKHTHACTPAHARIHTNTYTQIHPCTPAHMCTCAHAHILTFSHTQVHTCPRAHSYIHPLHM